MQDWLGPHTGVQVVIIVKIYKPYADPEGSMAKMPSVRMEAAVYSRHPTGIQATTDIVRKHNIKRRFANQCSHNSPKCTNSDCLCLERSNLALVVVYGTPILLGSLNLDKQSSQSLLRSYGSVHRPTSRAAALWIGSLESFTLTSTTSNKLSFALVRCKYYLNV